MVSILIEEKEETAKTRKNQEQRDLMVSILMEEKEEAAKRTTSSGDIDLSLGDGGHQNFL